VYDRNELRQKLDQNQAPAGASPAIPTLPPATTTFLPYSPYLPPSSLLPFYHPMARGALLPMSHAPAASCGLYGAGGAEAAPLLTAPPLYYHHPAAAADYFPLPVQHQPAQLEMPPPPTPPPGENLSASAVAAATAVAKKRRARTPDLGPALMSPKRFSSPAAAAQAAGLELSAGGPQPRRLLLQVIKSFISVQ
jgi:hypothetical protein